MPALERPPGFGDDGALVRAPAVPRVMDHHPVARAPGVMGRRGVGKERGEGPAFAVQMHHRKPCLARRVGPPRRDPAQAAVLGAPAARRVDVEKPRRRWLRVVFRPPPAAPGEDRGERGADRRRPPCPDAGHRGEPPVVGGDLQRLERVERQRVMDRAGGSGADAGDGPEQVFRRRLPPQPPKLRPASGGDHPVDRPCQPVAAVRQRDEPRQPLLCEAVGGRAARPPHPAGPEPAGPHPVTVGPCASGRSAASPGAAPWRTGFGSPPPRRSLWFSPPPAHRGGRIRIKVQKGEW